ncbi:hypothetical protein H4R22_003063 [Coemansia sp. RSA 1290]|nr:cytochrome P450 [Coemansia mojavensis]KAJ1739436.1 hypothetical protein LPJ68_004688 [Coemansia sp. RSA 1086]KAJ1751538.1 hypothetical protein LPJ79_002017 [Coemansia sp. RSA 1821]KAJ1873419.1 hypothetical protein LPJ55_002273 [Coemansia sp. RSA 990]KAJ2629870.1 hypothetical protein H4R22_003063 [Coemansia sp. RSA 1290]KAJ2670010.1 hypothetical protein IWW42_004209 [Coemansia sp. RSA 1085]
MGLAGLFSPSFVEGRTMLLLLGVAVVYGIYRLLVPPKVNDGGVPYIPAYKTLFWTFKPDPSRIDLCNKVDVPALKETGIARSWLWGRWMYKINDAEYARQLFLKPTVFKKIEMQTSLPYTFRVYAAGANIMSENGDYFKAHRAVVMPAFRRAWPVEHFQVHMQKLEGLIRQQPQQVDILNIGRRVALDILGHIIMGVDFGALDYTRGELLEMCWDIVEAGVEPLYLLFPFLDKYPMGKRKKAFANVKRFHEFIDEAIEKKRVELQSREQLNEDERDRADLLTLMIEAHEQTKKQGAFDEEGRLLPSMNFEELRNNTVVFFIAGHDGTAYSLCHLITELALHPDIQQRARDRVISVIGDSPDAFPTDEQLHELADLDMIIRESMRKSSSASDVRRELTEPVTLGPYTLPKGAWVHVDLWAMHHNPKHYPDPHKFIPERFAWSAKSDLAEMPHEHIPFSWAPFSEGGRKCLGHKFAMIAQRVLLITFVHRFTWTLPKDSPFWIRPRTNTMGLILPLDLKVDFTPRH